MGSSTLFHAEDKLREKADYHGWKMSIDLTLENQGVLEAILLSLHQMHPLLPGKNGKMEKSKQ